MHELIRSSALTGYSDLVLKLGGDPEKLLRRFRWTQDIIEQQDAAISYRSLIQLMELTAAKLNCRDFGLRLAQVQNIHILGPLAIIALHSETVEHALRSIIQQLDYYSPVCCARLDTNTNPARPILTFEAALTGEPNRRQTVELAIGDAHRELLILSDGQFIPRAVLFRHSPLATKATYFKHFQVHPKFDQEVNGIVITPDDLARPLKANDPYLRRVVVDYVKHSTGRQPHDATSQVDFLIRKLLSGTRCTLRVVAQHLALHERTLQRRLEREGNTFEEVLDGVRRQLARSLLTESMMPVAQIAMSLGYSEQSAFNRACRRWFGSSPLQIRRSGGSFQGVANKGPRGRRKSNTRNGSAHTTAGQPSRPPKRA